MPVGIPGRTRSHTSCRRLHKHHRSTPAGRRVRRPAHRCSAEIVGEWRSLFGGAVQFRPSGFHSRHCCWHASGIADESPRLEMLSIMSCRPFSLQSLESVYRIEQVACVKSATTPSQSAKPSDTQVLVLHSCWPRDRQSNYAVHQSLAAPFSTRIVVVTVLAHACKHGRLTSLSEKDNQSFRIPIALSLSLLSACALKFLTEAAAETAAAPLQSVQADSLEKGVSPHRTAEAY